MKFFAHYKKQANLSVFSQHIKYIFIKHFFEKYFTDCPLSKHNNFKILHFLLTISNQIFDL